MQNVKHIIYIMLENRSFDNVLGYLYDSDKNVPNHFIPPAKEKEPKKVFNGLNTGTYSNTDSKGKVWPVKEIKPGDGYTMPLKDPHEDYVHVNAQLFGSQHNPGSPTDPTPVPAMSGFVKDYEDQNENYSQIMECFGKESLTVLNDLAKNYAVSDAYFSSIPSQTNINRAFSLTGNSIGYLKFDSEEEKGMVNNAWEYSYEDGMDPVQYTRRTIWDVINANSKSVSKLDDWMVFYSQKWMGAEVIESKWGIKHKADYAGRHCFTRNLFTSFNDGKLDDHFQEMGTPITMEMPIEEANPNSFYAKLAAGTLPTFSYLEPEWFLNGTKDYDGFKGTIKNHNGNSYHPPADVYPGEVLLAELYNAIKNSPKWNETLLIINFDEHGGTYDHVAPPWNALVPWDEPSTYRTKPPADGNQLGFGFDRFGVRVPLILVSPWIEAGTVIRSDDPSIPFDHTSVLATILDQFGIERGQWGLGKRAYFARPISPVINRTTPRTDNPIIQPGEPSKTEEVNHPPSDLQIMITKRMFGSLLRETKLPKERFDEIHKKYWKEFETIAHMNESIQNILNEIGAELEKDTSENKPVENKEQTHQADSKKDSIGLFMRIWQWICNLFKR